MKNERKEELKDEIKNRISLALKDPILQQGFEIICKENAELKAKESFVGEQNRKLCDQQLKIEVLEKENAELKAESDFYNKERGNYKAMFFRATLKNNKAKELLKRYVPYRQITDSKAYKDLADETEQFLKENA